MGILKKSAATVLVSGFAAAAVSGFASGSDAGAVSGSVSVLGLLRILGCSSSSFGFLFFPGHCLPPFLFQAFLLRLLSEYTIPV